MSKTVPKQAKTTKNSTIIMKKMVLHMLNFLIVKMNFYVTRQTGKGQNKFVGIKPRQAMHVENVMKN